MATFKVEMKHKKRSSIDLLKILIFRLKCLILYLKIYNKNMIDELKDYFSYPKMDVIFTEKEVKKILRV